MRDSACAAVRKGYVFVECPEVYEFFGRDVYVPKEQTEHFRGETGDGSCPLLLFLDEMEYLWRVKME